MSGELLARNPNVPIGHDWETRRVMCESLKGVEVFVGFVVSIEFRYTLF